jgi:hypothetical protein
MAISFKTTNGSAIKNSHESYKIKDNENVLRMVGGLLPRYLYWLTTGNGKQIPAECLSFSREEEKFNNNQVDHVQDFFPEQKCSWAYSVNCIDPTDGKVKVFNLKKKLFAQILSAAEDLGLDPTDPDEGFDIVFKKVKTGSAAFNVEYTLSVLKLKKRPLTEAERTVVAAALTIDEKFPLPTSDEILKLLEKVKKGLSEEDDVPTETGIDAEAVSDLT